MAAPDLSDKPGDEPAKPLLVLLQEGRVPGPLISKLTDGFEEIEDFAFAMPRLEDLDPWLERIFQETLQALQLPDTATLTTSQPAARLYAWRFAVHTMRASFQVWCAHIQAGLA